MTVDVARVARVAEREAALGGLFARLAGTFESLETPLRVLLAMDDELALLLVRAERGYSLAFLLRDADIAEAALHDYLRVLDAAAQFTPSGAGEVERLLADRILLLAGGPEALAARAEELVGRAEERRIRRALRLVQRWSTRDVLGAATHLQSVVLRVLSAAEPSPLQDAMLLFVRTVRPADHLAWQTLARRLAAQGQLARKIAGVRAAGGLDVFGRAEFRSLVGPETSALQGVLGELWTWRSRAWQLRERNLVRTGLERGRRLALGTEEFRPLVVREPLRLAGREIYDGAVFLTRPLAGGPNVRVFEALPHATLQVQVREEVSLLDIAARDIEREMRRPGGLVLNTSDYSQTFVVRPAADGVPPTRYVVAPEFDSAAAPVVPAGQNIVPLVMLPSRNQLNGMAYHFIESLL